MKLPPQVTQGFWLPESVLLHRHRVPVRSWGQKTAKGHWEREGQRQGDTGPQRQRDRHRDKKRLNKRQQTQAADNQRKMVELEKGADRDHAQTGIESS